MFSESLCEGLPDDKPREECFALVRSGVSFSTRSCSLNSFIHKILVHHAGKKGVYHACCY